jgi:pimeloyl-ACP methyl ester carboxylesterase
MMKSMLVSAAAAAALFAAPVSAEMLRVRNTQTEIQIGGKGAGTVVLEYGLGSSKETWAPLLPVIDNFARSFAYNRLGTGRSGPAMKNPTPKRIADHLHDLLTLAQMPKPWTLVGHSMGGANMLTFARMYPNEVRAVVLIDATPFSQPEAQRRLTPDVYRELNRLVSVAGGTPRDEFRAFASADQEFRQLGPFPKIPVYLLRATRADPGDSPEYLTWRKSAQHELAALSPCPVERDIADAGHFIQRDKPKEVLAAIYEASKRNGC